MHLPIDHIVYVCQDLDQGIRELHEWLGCRPIYGGRHLSFGTHNALMNLGYGIYLELLAADPDNKEVASPRWMGVDQISKTNRITRVALKSSNLSQDLVRVAKISPLHTHYGKGNRLTGTGDMLSWQMSYPLAQPLVDPIPFMVEWKSEFHPTDTLNHNVNFLGLDIFTPSFSQDLINLFDPNQVQFHYSKTNKILLNIETNHGPVRIG